MALPLPALRLQRPCSLQRQCTPLPSPSAVRSGAVQIARSSSLKLDAAAAGPAHIALDPASAVPASTVGPAFTAPAHSPGGVTTTPDPITTGAATSGPAVTVEDTKQSGANSKENFKGDMLKPSVVNTPWVRALSVLATVAAMAGSTTFLPARLGSFLHVTAFAVWLGTNIWNTFFVGLIMFKNVPRQTFGRVQSHLFPAYFSLTGGANLLCLATLWLAGAAESAAGTKALTVLGVALATTAYNGLYLEPKCTKLMFDRYEIENKDEKTEADKDAIKVLYKAFGKWHGISALVNLVGLCCVIAHGWYLAGSVALVI